MTTMRLRWYQFSLTIIRLPWDVTRGVAAYLWGCIPQVTIMDLIFVTMMVGVCLWSWDICYPAIQGIFFNGQSPWELMSHGK